MAKQAAAKPGRVARLTSYLQDVRTELEKVTWPTQEDLKASTSVVLLFLVIMATMIGAMDLVFQRVVILLFSLV